MSRKRDGARVLWIGVAALSLAAGAFAQTTGTTNGWQEPRSVRLGVRF